MIDSSGRFRLCLACVLFLPGAAAAQAGDSGDESVATGVATVLRGLEEAGSPFNGALLVGGPDSVLFEYRGGMANFELEVPIRRGQAFRIASLSKQFAGVLALLLEQDGVVDLQAAVSTYLPALEGTPAGAATLQRLLDHRSGLSAVSSEAYLWGHVVSEYGWDWRANRASETFDREQFLERMAEQEQETDPGSRYWYCNTCYVLAGLALAAAAGTDYEALLSRRILEPLGMHGTGFDGLDELVRDRAYPYERAGGEVYPITRWRNLRPIGPAGAMYSTLADMERWVRALFHSDALLAPDARADLLPAEAGYRNGLQRVLMEVPGGGQVDVIMHTGQIAGTFGWVAYLPATGRHVIALSNIGFTFPQQRFMQEMVAVAAGTVGPADAG